MAHQPPRRRLAVMAAVSAVMMAGCISGGGATTSPAQPAGDTTSPAGTVTPIGSVQSAEKPCPDALAFWNLGKRPGWSQNSVSVGFFAPAAIDAFHPVYFVVYENDTILGMERWTGGEAVHVDGFTIPLDEELDGNHTISGRVHVDTNENETFDRGTDRPCYHNGSRNQAGPEPIDFSVLSAAETSTDE